MIDFDDVPVFEATEIWSGVEYGGRLNGKFFVRLGDWDALMSSYNKLLTEYTEVINENIMLKLDYEDIIKK